MTSYTIGAQMYSVRDRTQTLKDLDETLRFLRAIGYNTVQISGIGPDIPPERVAELLKKHALRCVSTHFGYERYLESPEEMVRIHKLWDCAYPGVGSMPAINRQSREGYIAFAQSAEALSERLAGDGLHFVYHNHAFEFRKFDGVTGMELLLQHAPRFLQFELDTYWVQEGGGNPVDWIHRVKGRMDVAHLKDMVGREPDSANPSMNTMAPIGEGNLDFPAILRALDETFVKYALIEQDNAVETDSLRCMEISYKNLAAMGGRF